MFQLYSWSPDSLVPIAAMIKEYIMQVSHAITSPNHALLSDHPGLSPSQP
jgi:hypothetical protein